ncbi:MAG TPA: glycosyltransferase family 39 protein [Propionibacteriaceae bacterium]|nr:glycosyltransferase family 39 protein [Propionibacteriaceae bacterium]
MSQRDGRLRQVPRAVWLAAGLFVLAVVIFAAWVWRPTFWVDEYLTQSAISRPWPDLIQRIMTIDPGPGPYYLAMKIWATVSAAPGWMRLPSVMATAGAVVLFSVLVRRMTDTWTAAFAAAVLLIMPNVSRFAQENRPYAFALLFSVLAVTLWQISLTRDGSGGVRSQWWSAGFGLAVAGMGLAHLYTLTLLPALAITALAGPAEDRRRRLLRTIIPAGVGVLAITPHIWLNLAHPTGSPNDPPLAVGSLVNVVGEMMPSEMTAALCVLALVGFAAAIRDPRFRPALILAVAWVVVPTVLLLAAKVAVDLPVIRVRYVLFLMPGVALLVALGLRHLARLSTALAVILVLALALVGLPQQVDIRQIDGHHTDEALAPLLRSARALNIPVVTANAQAVRLVNAATYPEALLHTGPRPRSAPYVAVVERTAYADNVKADFAYYQLRRWRPVVYCPLPQSVVLFVESTRLPARPAAAADLADRLEQATDGRVPCSAV